MTIPDPGEPRHLSVDIHLDPGEPMAILHRIRMPWKQAAECGRQMIVARLIPAGFVQSFTMQVGNVPPFSSKQMPRARSLGQLDTFGLVLGIHYLKNRKAFGGILGIAATEDGIPRLLASAILMEGDVIPSGIKVALHAVWGFRPVR